ncbi:MAG: hypothetical protein ACK46R_12305 [Bacteroidota bacterium]
MENVPNYLKNATLKEARMIQVFSTLLRWLMSPIGVLLTLTPFVAVPSYIFVHYYGSDASDMIKGGVIILLADAFIFEYFDLFGDIREDMQIEKKEINRYIENLKKEKKIDK